MAFLATRARAAVCRAATRSVHARAMATLHFTKDHEWVSVSWRAVNAKPRLLRCPRTGARMPPATRARALRNRPQNGTRGGWRNRLRPPSARSTRPSLGLDRFAAAQVDGDSAVIGITQYAQDQMGDVVHVSLPDVGDELSVG